jgi:hypothetical protein
MKRLVSLLAVASLCLALSASVFAGNVPIPKNGNVPIPKNGNVPIPKNGNVPIPKNGPVSITAPFILALLQLLGGRG